MEGDEAAFVFRNGRRGSLRFLLYLLLLTNRDGQTGIAARSKFNGLLALECRDGGGR